MSKENSSIHDFDPDLIGEYFSGLERQGPGSPLETLKALSFIDHLDENSAIADIGCGTGGQTRVIAQHVPGSITGIDLFPLFIDLFNKKAGEMDLSPRVKGVVESMDRLSFKKESLDLIWSEGAIYNIGFERGVKEWRTFLKPGGYLAVTEATWFTGERPAGIDEFWQQEYPEIDTVSGKVRQLEQAGYVPVAVFNLPENCWTDHYYIPQIDAQKEFLEKYRGNRAAEAFIAMQKREAELYAAYKEYYGYTFFIGKKI